jgi:Uncharacterized integral membrane protein
MTEDPTRATALPADADAPVHGSVGPVDPHADPATDPGLRPVDVVTPDAPTVPTPGAPTPGAPTSGAGVRRDPVVTHTRTGGLWTGLIASAVVLLFLLIFILQNPDSVQINFPGFTGSLPTGVALLLSAIAGLLLVAIPGGLRIQQLRRAARRGARTR